MLARTIIAAAVVLSLVRPALADDAATSSERDLVLKLGKSAGADPAKLQRLNVMDLRDAKFSAGMFSNRCMLAVAVARPGARTPRIQMWGRTTNTRAPGEKPIADLVPDAAGKTQRV